MSDLRERLQDLYERAWCQIWRWQYIAVVRLLPETADEIRRGGYEEGYDEGFQHGEEHALQCRGGIRERSHKGSFIIEPVDTEENGNIPKKWFHTGSADA